jgi:hypothetical protein
MINFLGMVAVLTVLAVSSINDGVQQVEIDILKARVWHLEALIELEDFENDREPAPL